MSAVDVYVYACPHNSIVATAIECQILMGGNFDVFDVFQLDRQKINPSNCLKTIQHLQVYGERQ